MLREKDLKGLVLRSIERFGCRCYLQRRLEIEITTRIEASDPTLLISIRKYEVVILLVRATLIGDSARRKSCENISAREPRWERAEAIG